MRSLVLAAAALVSAVPSRTAAQLANRAISVESGISTPFGGRGAAAAAFAVSASRWLDGFDAADLDGVLRVALAAAPETAGRGTAAGVLATVGLRLSLGRAPLRPQVFADVGWARPRRGASDTVAFGLGAALEWFPAPELSVSPRVALRGAGGTLAAEGVLAVAAYF
ncbi:MAG TPA: hypothetical protein VF841_13250 [Anaeromyxobacter sp.]